MSFAARLAARAGVGPVTRSVPSRSQSMDPPLPVGGFALPCGRRCAYAGRLHVAPPTAAEWAQALSTLAPPGLRGTAQSILFDVETTGLQLSGAMVFLIGLAGFDAQGPWVQQWLLQGPVDERRVWGEVRQALLAIPEHGVVVSFNGASFDRNLMALRMRRLGLWCSELDQLFERRHLDVLPICRRLWRHRLPDRRLMTLESELLGARRGPEPSGFEIAALGQAWLGGARDPFTCQGIAGAVAHNARDLIGLGAVVVAAARACGLSDDAQATLAAARHLIRVGRAEQAVGLLEQGLESRPLAGADGHGRELALELAAQLRRAGRLDEAHRWWTGICEAWPGHSVATIALAKDWEHRLARPDVALRWARTLADPCPRRLARLETKARRRAFELAAAGECDVQSENPHAA